jgi:hypothetical protein
MKPDWKDAPEWANWLAMDEDGDWYWYSSAPRRGASSWLSGGDLTYAGRGNDWEDKLYERPQTTNPDARPGSEGQGT